MTYTEPTDKSPEFVRLPLTDDQKAQVRASTGKDAEAIELSAQELEERIAPRMRLTAD
jgi:hypothetical protein